VVREKAARTSAIRIGLGGGLEEVGLTVDMPIKAPIYSSQYYGRNQTDLLLGIPCAKFTTHLPAFFGQTSNRVLAEMGVFYKMTESRGMNVAW
jgi:hypothetical protein